jgi:hypothetical protein
MTRKRDNNRDEHKKQQPADRKVLPEPEPGFDIGAHIHSQITKVYNGGLLQFGTADKFLIITKMESLKSVLQNLEGSVIHDCYQLDGILKTEPNYLQRIGLTTPPGHGYARYTMYDLSQPEYPGIAAWFNPLVAGDRRWIPGDQPAANRFKAELLVTGHYSSYKEWSAGVLQRMTAPTITPDWEQVLAGVLQHMTAPTITPDWEQVLAGVKIEEDGEPNELCLGKVNVTTQDGKVHTAVTCTRETYNRAIDLLEGVMVGDGHRVTKEDLQTLRDQQQVPVIDRGEQTEPLFRMFGVRARSMGLAVEGLASRMGIPYPPGCK